jgi:hypothetical protein
MSAWLAVCTEDALPCHPVHMSGETRLLPSICNATSLSLEHVKAAAQCLQRFVFCFFMRGVR